jgi:hypothetical protein
MGFMATFAIILDIFFAFLAVIGIEYFPTSSSIAKVN